VIERRVAYLAGSAVLFTAFVGYFAGVRGTARDVEVLRARGSARGAELEPAAVAPRSYADMRTKRYGDNAAAATAAFRAIADHVPPVASAGSVGTKETLTSPDDRAAAIAARARRRAFDGAPPTIPHRIDQGAPGRSPDCLACHERGLAVATLRAPAMSHRRLDACPQCHVVAVDPRPVANTPSAPENTFVGTRATGSSQRAWPGAPPLIPHPTLMRSACTSCHGPQGAQGLHTPHPFRESCQQCHAPSAALDQRGMP
jgi:cytochrome c-type protein NapB